MENKIFGEIFFIGANALVIMSIYTSRGLVLCTVHCLQNAEGLP
jgi:hypothetical protein